MYRFRQCDELSIDAFDKDKLFFSPPYKMNDDFDSMIYFNQDSIASALKNTAESENFQSFLNSIRNGEEFPSIIQNTIPPEILANIKENILQMTPIDANKRIDFFRVFLGNQLIINASEIAQIVQHYIKVACFSENITSAAMWGYYADSGKGFALAYDFHDEINFKNNCTLARVIYDDERLDASEFAAWLLARKILIEHGLITPVNNSPELIIPCPDLFMSAKVLLHKATSWVHEQEWRLIFTGNSNCDHPSILKRPCAIYLGRNISDIHEKILRHIAVEKNIPVYKMKINENDSAYKLNPDII